MAVSCLEFRERHRTILNPVPESLGGCPRAPPVPGLLRVGCFVLGAWFLVSGFWFLVSGSVSVALAQLESSRERETLLEQGQALPDPGGFDAPFLQRLPWLFRVSGFGLHLAAPGDFEEMVHRNNSGANLVHCSGFSPVQFSI